jgi:sulfur-oxidizing protein SoxY
VCALLVVLQGGAAGWAAAAGAGAADGERWAALRGALFGDRPILDGAGVISLGAPARAQDAALVPIEIRALPGQAPARAITTVHLVIDHNPAPVAGVFHMAPASGWAVLATRVRISEHTQVRAIAETSDGALYMASRFVKAAGGCSAPASRDHGQALARLGELRLQPLTPFAPGAPSRVKLMIRHPNYSGLQKDQLSQQWIPPHFVTTIAVRYAGRPVLTVEGDISLSENPTVEFEFVPETAGALAVEVADSEANTFRRSWPLGLRPGS